MANRANHNYFSSIETDRLTLRPLAIEDTDFIFRHFSDPAVTEHLMDEPPVTEYEQAEEIIRSYLEPKRKTHNRWGITVRKADNQLIGTCGYHKWDKRHHRAEIGYDLSPGFWGQGYMTEALRAIISNGFGHMDLNRIEALVYVENERSIRLLESLGFKREAILRDYFCLNGKFYDHYLYSLLRREWKT
jgi:ribosomal-protein-alanine N-acetyltransferase